MKKFVSLSLSLLVAAVFFGACANVPEETDDIDDPATEERDVVEEPGADPAAAPKPHKCKDHERWCDCGGCTNIELKCNPYCQI